MSKRLQSFHDEVSHDLDRIANRFEDPRPKITLIIRVNDTPEGVVFLSDDDFDKAVEAVRALMSQKKPFFEVAPKAGAA